MLRKFINEQEKEICRQYNEDKLSTVVLAKRWECGFSTIGDIIRRNGYKLRNSSESHKGQKAWNKIFTKKEELQICNEYFSKEKPGIVVLGKKYNCRYGTISNIIKRNGYKLRTISESNIGQKRSEETKRKMRGRESWCKGLTKETDERIMRAGEKLRGENNPAKRLDVREKMSKSHEGKTNGPLSEETKNRLRKKALLRIQNNHGPFKDTKPELKMKEILNGLNIPFKHQFRLGNHLFDFHVPNTNILIEVDGDYWHGNPKKFKKLNKIQQKIKQRDLKKDVLVKENNYILLRFWENDILNNTEKVKKELTNLL